MPDLWDTNLQVPICYCCLTAVVAATLECVCTSEIQWVAARMLLTDPVGLSGWVIPRPLLGIPSGRYAS